MKKHWKDITIAILALSFVLYMLISHEREQNKAINILVNRQNQIIQAIQGNPTQPKPLIKPNPKEKTEKK